MTHARRTVRLCSGSMGPTLLVYTTTIVYLLAVFKLRDFENKHFYRSTYFFVTSVFLWPTHGGRTIPPCSGSVWSTLLVYITIMVHLHAVVVLHDFENERFTGQKKGENLRK